MEIKSFSEDITTGSEVEDFGPRITTEFGMEPTKLSRRDAIATLKQIEIKRPVIRFWPADKPLMVTKSLFDKAQKRIMNEIKILQAKKYISPVDARDIGNLKKLLTSPYPTISKATTKSVSSNLAKHLLTKQGLKASAKTFGKIVTKLSGAMMSPWLIPLIWSPEIIDIAKSKDIQKVWKNMQDETWWKEAAKRDEIVREKAKRGEKVVFSKNVIPYGEFYHRDKGWY